MSISLPQAAAAVDCTQHEYLGLEFTACEVDTTKEELRLFHRDTNGEILGSFPNVERSIAGDGLRLAFAMNAGMYHNDLSPVGLYVENGVELASIVTSDGPGNFGLLPNGVFCIREGRADVIESLRFERETTSCDFATQSGPMLVIDGELHPRFLVDSDSIHVRNGVGTTKNGQQAYFVISGTKVNFHTFGSFFRDVLKVPNALYFDGKVSRLFAPQLDRHDRGFPMGPIVGVAEPAG